MKTKINLGNELSLNKTVEIYSMIIVVTAVFHENNKFYQQAFLDECLYVILCYIMIEFYIIIELAFLKELIKQVHRKSMVFITVDICWIKVLSFNQMSAVDDMIYWW